MQATEDDRGRLAAAIKEARLKRGFPKRAPYARHLGIDDSTLAIIEAARPGTVSDEMLDFVTTDLGWARGAWRAILAGNTAPIREREATSVAEHVAKQMNPDLRRFSDAELLDEIRLRMLYAAARLGGEPFEWRTDPDGDTELVSRTVDHAGSSR